MKLNPRYLKIFLLYLLSLLISNQFINAHKNYKVILQSIIGYTFFASGLKYLTIKKNKK